MIAIIFDIAFIILKNNKKQEQDNAGNITDSNQNLVKVELEDLNLCKYFATKFQTDCKNEEYIYVELTQEQIDSVTIIDQDNEAYPVNYLLLDAQSLKELENFKNLTGLGRWVSKSDLTPLANLTNLESLYLRGENISNIDALSNLSSLEILSLNYTKVSNLNALSNLKKLKSLSIGDTNVKDVSPLSSLSNLEYLLIYGTKVSDLTPLDNITDLTIDTTGGM